MSSSHTACSPPSTKELPAGEGKGCPALLCAVRPHLQHWGQGWVPQYNRAIKLLESSQRRAMKKGLEGKTYKMQLRSLSSVELRWPEEIVICLEQRSIAHLSYPLYVHAQSFSNTKFSILSLIFTLVPFYNPFYNLKAQVQILKPLHLSSSPWVNLRRQTNQGLV